MSRLIAFLQRAGLAACELAAMSLKSVGSYLARALSFEGAELRVVDAPVDAGAAAAYDRAAAFLELLFGLMARLPKSAEDDDEAQLMLGRSAWRANFWGTHQRIMRSLLISSKLDACVRKARAALAAGRCAVIGLQSTGEAATGRAVEAADGAALEDGVSAPLEELLRYVERQVAPALTRGEAFFGAWASVSIADVEAVIPDAEAVGFLQDG